MKREGRWTVMRAPRVRVGRRARLAVVAMAALTSMAGCGGSDEPTEPLPAGGEASLDRLGAAVWTAITAGDTAALERLRLSEREHNDRVWPEQPAAREPTAAANLDLWWGNIQRRNAAAVRRLLAEHAGSDLALRAVECPGEPRSYRTFRALTDCRLVLEGGGRTVGIRAFRQVVVLDGRYTVVRYDGG